MNSSFLGLGWGSPSRGAIRLPEHDEIPSYASGRRITVTGMPSAVHHPHGREEASGGEDYFRVRLGSQMSPPAPWDSPEQLDSIEYLVTAVGYFLDSKFRPPSPKKHRLLMYISFSSDRWRDSKITVWAAWNDETSLEVPRFDRGDPKGKLSSTIQIQPSFSIVYKNDRWVQAVDTKKMLLNEWTQASPKSSVFHFQQFIQTKDTGDVRPQPRFPLPLLLEFKVLDSTVVDDVHNRLRSSFRCCFPRAEVKELLPVHFWGWRKDEPLSASLGKRVFRHGAR